MTSGKGSLVIQNETLFKSDGFINAPAIFIKFKFQGNINIDPELFELRDKQNSFIIVGKLRDFRNGRTLQIIVNGTSISFTSNLVFGSDRVNYLTVGFV